MLKLHRTLLACLLIALVCGSRAQGQNLTGTQFNFTTPGARSLGMGGAFLALADDSTAAYTNPAGLARLVDGGSEIALEIRNWDNKTSYIAFGRLNGEPTGIGLDTANVLGVVDASDQSSDISFFSAGFVLPRGFTLALYKHKLANYAAAYESEGVFYDFPDGDDLITSRTLPFLFASQVQVDGIGASGAYQIQNPFGRGTGSLSVGGGVSRYQLDLQTFKARLAYRDYEGDETDRMLGGFFGPADFLPDATVGTRSDQGDSSAWGFNLGFLWQLGKKDRWSIGGAYRRGPEFSVDVTIDGDLSRKETLRVPDVYGLGISYSASEGKTKIALDVQEVRYSQRIDDLFLLDDAGEQQFSLDDSREIHLGVERVVFTSGDFVGTARAGAWRETAHELEYHGLDPRDQALYPQGRDNTHWAAGVGLVIREDYQIDAAVDRSDRVDIFSFSVVYFF